MLSPAPVSKKISGRSEDSESKEESVASDFEVISNLEAVTTEEEGKKTDADDQDIDSLASTITEEKKNPPTGGSKDKDSLDSLSSEDSGSGTSESNSDSDSDSDSSSSSTESKYKMSSNHGSMNKSPVCDGERSSFEEWHSKWEVFAGDYGFDEYIPIKLHPDLPIKGHATPKEDLDKDEKRALKMNRRALASIRISFVAVWSVDAMIESTIDEDEWTYGQIHLVLQQLYDKY